MKALLRPSVLLAALLAAGLPVLSSAAAPGKTATDSAADKRIAQILKTLASVHRYGGLAISPDGNRLAWTSEEKDGTQVNVANTDGTHIHTVALGKTFKGCEAGDVNWAPDGKRFAFLSNCSSDKKDAEQNQIYMVTAGATKLAAHPLTKLKGFVHDLSWAPDGRELGILYVAGDTHGVAATAATKARIGVIGVTGVEHQQMAKVDAASGKVQLVTPQALFVYEYSWSPDSARIAYVAAPPPGDNNWWVAQLYAQATQTNSKPDVVLDPNTVSGSLHGLQIAWPRWSPDGSHIALIGGLMSDQGSTGGDIYVVPSAGGAAVDVTPGIHSSPAWLTWTADDRLLVTADASGVTRISAFTLHGDQAASETTLLTLDAGIRRLATAGHGDFAFVHSTFTEAPEIYTGRFSMDENHQPTGVTTAPHAITHLNAAIKPLWGKAVSMEWTNDGSQVQGWLLLPADYDPHKTYPMIVEVHGGPSAGVQPRWGGGAQFSALGYFVLMANPRGSFGEGEAFTQGVRKDMGYGDLRDILAGVDAVEKQYPVDDKRLGLTGWSYGGFMSMFAPTQTHRFRAAVAGAGLSDWLSYYGENSIDEWMIPFYGASVYDDPAVYAKSSAINFIKQDKTPTLVVVGERDAECPAPQSFEFWHALRTEGVPTTLVVYAGEGHGFHKKEDRIDVLKRSLAWFQKYLGQT